MPKHGIALLAEALVEFAVYDVRTALFGFRSAYGSAQCRLWTRCSSARENEIEKGIQEAVDQACCLYVKPVRCLQRSIVLARMMRRRGLQPQVRIGYRTDPFFGHAWIEMDGEVMGDSRAYKRKLRVIDTI